MRFDNRDRFKVICTMNDFRVKIVIITITESFYSDGKWENLYRPHMNRENWYPMYRFESNRPKLIEKFKMSESHFLNHFDEISSDGEGIRYVKVVQIKRK